MRAVASWRCVTGALLATAACSCLPAQLVVATETRIAAVEPARSSGTAELDGDALKALQLVVPVAGVRRADLRDTYRDVRTGHAHEALDIPAARGTPVTAATAGRIVKLFHSVPGGLTLYQFDPAQRFALYYAHLEGYAPGLREGMEIARGQVIGYVGTSGNAPPDAPHLHFALFRLGPQKRWWQGAPIDPFPFLNDP